MGLWMISLVLVVGALVGAGVSAWLARRRVERERTASQSVLGSDIDIQAIFDHMADGVVVLDGGHHIIMLNQSAADLLGLELGSRPRLDKVDTFEVFSTNGEPVPPEGSPTAAALRGEFLVRTPLNIRRKDTGVTATAQISTSPIKDRTGRTVHVLVIYRDITDRMRLDEVSMRLAAIVESSEDAIVSKNERGIVTSWNRAAERIFGYTAEEMIGESIKVLLPPDRQNEESEILRRIQCGEVVANMETRRIRKDGSEIVISATISPIRDANGRIVGASKVARDITAQRRMERQIQQGQKMEAIGQLTGGIAHDFNNLLGVVMGNLDLMEPLVEDRPTVLKRLKTAQKAAVRGADLTRRLLAFSCREDLNPTLTALGHSIRNTLELAQRGLGPEIRIVVELDPAMPDVMVDRAGLESVVLNLVINARDAMPEGGVLTVTTHLTRIDEDYPPVQAGELKAARYAYVTVSDTGHGMPRETLERAFEPFFTTKPRGRGTGLGLAMVYGFVKQSGGTARIYSEVGYGTTVSFYLPVPETYSEPVLAHDGVVPTTNLAGCTVLIVDDEEDLLEIAAAYVEEIGCTALQATDGASALEMLAEAGPIDVMLTDIIMPGGISGAALAQRARSLRPEMKIIYSSGFPADALAERPFLLADGPLLRKPYHRAEVHALVRRALAERETVGERLE
jgi:PAS domain S-box-containing protein